MKSVIPPRTPLPASRRQRGFTLIELVIVVTMVGVLAALAAPSMQQYVRNSRIQSTAQELYFSLQTARSEATKRQANIVVCASANPTGTAPICIPTSSTADATGWIVFVDVNNNFQRNPSTEELLESHTFDTTKLKLLADNDRKVGYVSTGFANSAATLSNSTSILICDSRGVVDNNGGTSETNSVARGISIINTGRAQVTKTLSTLSDWASDNSWTCS